MALNINQFAQTTVQGEMDLQFAGSVISAQVDSTQVADLIAGQAVKLVNSAGGVPKVLGLTANSDAAFGFVIRNLKDITYPTGARVEIALNNSVMYMTANGAIARGAPVEVVFSTNKVTASTGANPVIGYAFDKAAADGDLIRVYVGRLGAAAIADPVNTLKVTATLAEINAGKTLISGVAGKQIRVTSFVARVLGTFAAGTSVDLQDSAATKVAQLLEAALTNGAVLVPASANVTLGAGFGADLLAGSDLLVANTGAAQTTGTSITFTISYDLI